jgi:DNA-binding response OmpR family regulator
MVEGPYKARFEPSMHIGILEDEITQQEMYRLWFTADGFNSDCFDTVQKFTEALETRKYDILIIDWMVPDGNGIDVLAWVRKNIGWDIPVIFITAKDAELDIVSALKAGADDYVVKPPKYHELMARIESLARRSKPAQVLNFGDYRVDRDRRCIEVDGKAVELTQKEFELVCHMFQSPGVLLSRVSLLEKLWGLNADVDTRTIDTHVSRIRRKLDIGPKHGWQIFPVYGWGYRIEKVDKTTE